MKERMLRPFDCPTPFFARPVEHMQTRSQAHEGGNAHAPEKSQSKQSNEAKGRTPF
jgi:hypothetical protein